MTKIGPKVSVVITCYNYEKYVEEAIGSVKNQTYKNIELIIIDDGSTDNSLKITEKYKNFAKVISRENKGIVYTRNEAIKVSRGDYIIQLDADDRLDSDYIEKTVAHALRENSDIVYTNFKKFGAENEISNFPEYSLEELKNHNFIHISSLVKKSAIGQIRFDEELTGKTHEDWDFFLSLGVQGVRLSLCSDTFLNYRIHRTGRNNMLQSNNERFQYTSVYSYITQKHVQAGHPGFNYLIGAIFAGWYQEAGGEMNELISEREKLQNELQVIKTSRSYRLARRFALLVRLVKK